jgi:hypothetical protein
MTASQGSPPQSGASCGDACGGSEPGMIDDVWEPLALVTSVQIRTRPQTIRNNLGFKDFPSTS